MGSSPPKSETKPPTRPLTRFPVTLGNTGKDKVGSFSIPRSEITPPTRSPRRLLGCGKPGNASEGSPFGALGFIALIRSPMRFPLGVGVGNEIGCGEDTPPGATLEKRPLKSPLGIAGMTGDPKRSESTPRFGTRGVGIAPRLVIRLLTRPSTTLMLFVGRGKDRLRPPTPETRFPRMLSIAFGAETPGKAVGKASAGSVSPARILLIGMSRPGSCVASAGNPERGCPRPDATPPTRPPNRSPAVTLGGGGKTTDGVGAGETDGRPPANPGTFATADSRFPTPDNSPPIILGGADVGRFTLTPDNRLSMAFGGKEVGSTMPDPRFPNPDNTLPTRSGRTVVGRLTATFESKFSIAFDGSGVGKAIPDPRLPNPDNMPTTMFGETGVGRPPAKPDSRFSTILGGREVGKAIPDPRLPTPDSKAAMGLATEGVGRARTSKPESKFCNGLGIEIGVGRVTTLACVGTLGNGTMSCESTPCMIPGCGVGKAPKMFGTDGRPPITPPTISGTIAVGFGRRVLIVNGRPDGTTMSERRPPTRFSIRLGEDMVGSVGTFTKDGLFKPENRPPIRFPLEIDGSAVGNRFGTFGMVTVGIVGFARPESKPPTKPPTKSPARLDCTGVRSGLVTLTIAADETAGLFKLPRKPLTMPPTTLGTDTVGNSPGITVNGDTIGFRTPERTPPRAFSGTFGAEIVGTKPGKFVGNEMAGLSTLSKTSGGDNVGSNPGMFVKGESEGFATSEATPPTPFRTLRAPPSPGTNPLNIFGALMGTAVGKGGRLVSCGKRFDTRPPTTPSRMFGRETLGCAMAAVGTVRPPGSPKTDSSPSRLAGCVGRETVTDGGSRELRTFRPDANPPMTPPTTEGIPTAGSDKFGMFKEIWGTAVGSCSVGRFNNGGRTWEIDVVCNARGEPLGNALCVEGDGRTTSGVVGRPRFGITSEGNCNESGCNEGSCNGGSGNEGSCNGDSCNGGSCNEGSCSEGSCKEGNCKGGIWTTGVLGGVMLGTPIGGICSDGG